MARKLALGTGRMVKYLVLGKGQPVAKLTRPKGPKGTVPIKKSRTRTSTRMIGDLLYSRAAAAAIPSNFVKVWGESFN